MSRELTDIAHTHTQHNRFTALWNLSGKTRVSRYQKKHSPTTLIVVINHPYQPSPDIAIDDIVRVMQQNGLGWYSHVLREDENDLVKNAWIMKCKTKLGVRL